MNRLVEKDIMWDRSIGKTMSSIGALISVYKKETSMCIFYFQMNFVKQIWIIFLLFTILHRLLFALDVFLSLCPVILNKMRSWKEFKKTEKGQKKEEKKR
jgi:uncharacterized protein HemY